MSLCSSGFIPSPLSNLDYIGITDKYFSIANIPDNRALTGCYSTHKHEFIYSLFCKSSQTFSQDLKSGPSKCTIGHAQMNNL